MSRRWLLTLSARWRKPVSNERDLSRAVDDMVEFWWMRDFDRLYRVIEANLARMSDRSLIKVDEGVKQLNAALVIEKKRRWGKVRRAR